MKITTGQQLADACRKLVKDYKTLYVMGCFGAPLTASAKRRYIAAQSYNRKSTRTAKINSASSDTFGFDCVGMIKGLLWDWDGNTNSVYGGASYGKNGVPDCDANVMLNRCNGISRDFSNIPVGAAVGMHNHIGVDIGDGLAVECTPAWDDGCQISAVGNIGAKTGYHTRTWERWGMLPWLTYDAAPAKDSKTGWVKDSRGWYYMDNGKRRTSCWIKDSKDWVYLDDKGYMLTNAWVKDSHGWCFVKDDGRILRDGYASDSKGQHYVDSTGHIAK